MKSPGGAAPSSVDGGAGPGGRANPAGSGGESAPGRVYWMESSKRSQALAWLARDDLEAGERLGLDDFVRRYRTGVALGGAERRKLRILYDRLARRLGT